MMNSELLDQTPKFTVGEAQALAKDIFGIAGELTPLPSERDQNFLLTTASGEKYVLKIANASDDLALLDAQNQMMAHLNRHGVRCPQALPSADGETITQVTALDGKTHALRLVSYLPGLPYGELRQQPDELVTSLGRYLGQVSKALESFEHPAIHRDFYWDLANAPRMVAAYRPMVEPGLGAAIDYLSMCFYEHTQPLLPQLRRSAIHNDANNLNVIVGEGDDLYSRGRQVVGVIDFGDMVHSYTVGELAVAIAYAVLDKPDPLATACQMAAGYHQEYPLTEAEVGALPGLVTMRLCASACIAAHQSSQRPEDEYLTVSQGPIRRMLPWLAEIPLPVAETTLREACGFGPLPETKEIENWLKAQAKTAAPIVKPDPKTANYLVFDLSVSSPLIEMDDSRQPQDLILLIEEAGADFGIGRYDEARLFSGKEDQTIHLGLDIIAPPGTPVYAPIAGMVRSVRMRGTVILKHQTDKGTVFYTLYRGLNATPQGLETEQEIQAGEQIGEIGTESWAPHLHFQIATDLLRMGSRFPKYCPASQRSAWGAQCLDPNLLLGIPEENFPAQALDKAQTKAIRLAHLGPSVRTSYQTPLKIVRGWMQYLFAQDGRRYLDAYNNVPHVGHCHPKVAAAGRAQMRVLNTNTRYLHDHINRYAQKLTATLPETLSVCYLVNSGSEANELALRLARAYTGQKDTLVLEAAYHGNTTGMIDISPYKHDGPGGEGAPTWVHTAPIPDIYRGPYKADDPDAAEKYASHIQEAIEGIQAQGRGLACFIHETCPSVGGQIFLPEGYLGRAFEMVREAGGVAITDEVQTGYGRIGSHFYAFEAHDVVPDIVVLGKPIGNGHPLAVVVTRPEIAAAFDNGMEFFSTFGGNPVSSLVGLAVLEAVQEEGLQQHALKVGEHLLAGLRPLKDKYPIVGDVRGSGLFLGVELVRDRETLEPAGEEAGFIASRMSELGVLIGTDGPYHNVLKIRPPMPFTMENADTLLAALEQVLWEDFEG